MTRTKSTERLGVCCSGNWIIDHVKTIDLWPPEETLADILDEELGTGGAAYNVSVDLARFQLGLPLYGLGLVGDDADGQRILADCGKHGIDSRFLRTVAEEPTAYTDVMNVRDTGRRTFFHNRGANALLGPEHFCVEELDCRILSLGYLLLLDTLDDVDTEYGTKAARVLAQCREAGIVTAVDAVSENSDRFPRVIKPSLPHTDYLMINEIEAGRTAGREVRAGSGDEVDRDALEAAARDLLECGVNEAVVVHTPHVALGLTRDGRRVWQPTLNVPQSFIKGSVGAGDAFFAGMLVGIHESWNLERCLTFANAAAASCLRHPTCTGGVGSAQEIWRLSEEYPLRG